MEELVRVIDWIEVLSPRIWAIYVQRQYIGAFVNLGWAIGILAVVVTCFLWTKRLMKSEYNDDLAWIPLVVVASLFMLSILLLAESIWSFLTPEYQAIKDLLSTLE
jgi:hypothetical protein